MKDAHELFTVQYIKCADLSSNLRGDAEVHGSYTNEKQVKFILLTFTLALSHETLRYFTFFVFSTKRPGSSVNVEN